MKSANLYVIQARPNKLVILAMASRNYNDFVTFSRRAYVPIN